MAKSGTGTIEQLEREIARLRQRLAGEERTTGPAGFLGGFALGALAGGVLALIFAPQAGDQTRDQLRDASDAILLRGRAGESDTPATLAEAPAPATTAMPFSASAAPARMSEPAAPEAPAADAGTSQEAATPAPASQVMASPAPPPPASADVPTPARQPAEELPSSLPGEGGHCPYTHPIKGNKSSSGELIYHLPGSRFYERTNPEMCFATEDAARAAGYRAAKG
jgi:hypothetical protein